MSAQFRITSVDYAPDDLYPQVPFSGRLLRKIAGPDRPDYWLAELESPLSWNNSGRSQSITHLVLSSRYEGQTITPSLHNLLVGVAYVVDPSVLTADQLDLSKCRYIAIGVANGAS
jgi:hypothetical protein